jgi:hypothetical protein
MGFFKKGFVCLALIPPFFLDCVVAIGVLVPTTGVNWIASGFLYGHLAERHPEKGNRYSIYLVTSRHVTEGKETIQLRFNPEGDVPSREFNVVLREKGRLIWYAPYDVSVDVVVIPVNVRALEAAQIKFAYFHSDAHVADREIIRELEMTEGDGVFTLGFPLGLVGGARNFVIARQGIIARIRDVLSGSGHEFLIDSSIFPGNSGGPVVLRTDISSIQGTKPQRRSYLIGVVKGYVPYRDVIYSEHPKRPRVAFEENSGLASIVLMDYVKEAIEAHRLSAGLIE